MTKAEFYREHIELLMGGARANLINIAKKVIKEHGEGEDSILLHDVGINSPIYKEDPHDVNLSHVISGVWLSFDGKEEKITFSCDDAIDSGYDLNIEDLDTDMVIYLLGELESI